jgi:hypothetical protein
VIIFVFISITLPEIKTKEINYISVEIINEETKEEKIPQKPTEVKKDEIKALPPKKKPSNVPIKKENIEIAKKENIKPKPPQKKPKIIIPKEKIVEKKINKPENQNNDDFFDNMLKNLAENEPKPIKPVKKIESKVNTKPQRTREEIKNITKSIGDKIYKQIYENYTLPPAPDLKVLNDISVNLRIYVGTDGIINKTIIDKSSLKKARDDPTYLPYVEAAQRAIRKLRKFTKLPQDEYKYWKIIDIRFTPYKT